MQAPVVVMSRSLRKEENQSKALTSTRRHKQRREAVWTKSTTIEYHRSENVSTKEEEKGHKTMH